MYLNNNQISHLAEYAATSYEFSCCWRSAYDSVRDEIQAEYGFMPRSSLVKLVIRHAQAIWEGHKVTAQFGTNLPSTH